MAKDDLPGIRRRFAERLLSTGRLAGTAAHLAARRLAKASGATDGALGEKLARELDQMKGMAMKVGQIVSYFDGILPEEAHAALRALQTGQRVVAFETMSEVIRAAFGAEVDTLFESFERKPIAAASIGQVYRARFAGAPVVVKVQYPGIAETIRADFGRIAGFAGLVSMATAVDGPALVDEIRSRFLEECDYEQEARNQAAFAAAFASTPWVHVPSVLAARTRKTVLTSAFCEGRAFYDFVENATQAERDRAGLRLVEFAYRSLYGLEAINADPHPGNYLFAADGAVVFLDFGCVRRFDSPFMAAERLLTQVVLDGRRADFDAALTATGMVGNAARFDFEHHWRYLRLELSPYLSSNFRFDAGHLRATMELAKASNPNARRLAIPPQWIWLERLRFGLHAVLARLGASGDFATVLRQALESKPSRLRGS